MQTKRNYGLLYAITCILLWSFIPVVSRFGQVNLDNFQFLFWSNSLSLLVVGLFWFFQKNSNPPQSLLPKQFLYVLFLGFLGCTFYYLCLYFGYANGNGLEVLVIQYCWPLIMIVLSAILLKERLSLLSYGAVIAGFCGILLVLTKGNISELKFSNLTVALIVLLGAFSFALFSVLSKKFKGEPYTITTLLFLGGLITSTISLFIFSKFAWPTQDELIPVIINGAFINGISYIFWLKALEKIKASTAATLVFLAPVLSSIWIVLFFKEPFYISYAIGLSLVIVAGLITVKNQ